MAKPVTAAKTGLYISLAPHVATNDTLAELDALADNTWAKIGGITNLGEFGATFQEIASEPMDADATGKYKGMRNDGSLSLTLERMPDDTGQAKLMEALASYEDYTFKVVLNDKPSGTGAKPTRMYFPGKVMSFTTNVGGPNNLVTASCNIGINGAVIEGAKVAGS